MKITLSKLSIILFSISIAVIVAWANFVDLFHDPEFIEKSNLYIFTVKTLWLGSALTAFVALVKSSLSKFFDAKNI